MRTPEIELLWWEGCPSTDRALSELQDALAELDLAGAHVQTKEIRTDDDAGASGFFGSPTILIDGADLVPAGPDDVIGLSCRVYRHRDNACVTA